MSFYTRGLQSQIGGAGDTQEPFIPLVCGGALALAGGIAYLERGATSGTRVATGALLGLLTAPAGFFVTALASMGGGSTSLDRGLPLATGLAIPATFVAWGLRSK